MNKNKNISQSAPSPSERAGVRLCILGAGESGVGAAYLAQQQGYDVFVSDFGAIDAHYKNSCRVGTSASKKISIQKVRS